MAVPRLNSAPIQEPQEETHLINDGNTSADATAGEDEGLLPPSQTRDPSEPLSKPFSLLLLIGPALLAGIIVKAFDIDFLNTSYARLASHLHHFKDASWIVLTDSICSAFFVPLYSYLLRSFGVRRMTLVAFGAFAMGLGLCAISSSFWQLLTSRFVVGLGSSGITVLSMIIINEIVGIKLLPLWESFVTCIETATGMAAGPLGALIFRRISWNSVFYLELACAVIALGMLYFSFEKFKSHPYRSRLSFLSSGNSNVPRLDVFGWLLLVLAVSTPLLALTLGDNLLPWSHPLEITLLVSAPILMGSFVYFEAKVATNPVINMTPIFKIEYLKVLLQVFGVISTFNVIVFVIPPYIQVRSFDDHSFEDWALTCVFIGLPAGAILGGYLIKTGTFPVQRIMLVNAIVLEVLTILFLTRAIKPELARFSPLLAGFGLCTGVWQSSLLYATLSSTQKEWWPQTLALYYLIETFGADLGVASMSSIMRSRAKSGIRASLGRSATVEKIILDAMENLESIRLLDESSRQKVLSAFEQAIHISFILPCTLAAVVIILAAAMVVNPKEAFSEDPVDDEEEHLS